MKKIEDKKAGFGEGAMKVIQWYDVKNNELLYGIDIKVRGTWFHMNENKGEALFFKTEQEVRDKIKLITTNKTKQ